jgi:hypothetical protein
VTPRPRAIVVDATGAPNAQLRTLIHEAAHALGVDYRSHSRERAEVIVESVFFSSGCLNRRWLLGCTSVTAVTEALRDPRFDADVRDVVAGPRCYWYRSRRPLDTTPDVRGLPGLGVSAAT